MRNTEDLSRALFALIAEQDIICKRLTYGTDKEEWASKVLTPDAFRSACLAIWPNTKHRKNYGGATDWKMLSVWLNPYTKKRGMVVNVIV